MSLDTSDPVVLTTQGRALLEERLARAQERRDQITDELRNERAEELISERNRLDQRIVELSQVLRTAVAPADIVDDPSLIEIGDQVEVRFDDGSTETFLIVHPIEAGLDELRTSSDSPLARAVLGHRPGDEVTLTTPQGEIKATVVGRDRIG